MRQTTTPLTFIALLLGSGLAPADVLHLPIGDPERRDRTAPVVLDAVTDTRTGELLTPDELGARLDGVRLLFVGESHTDVDFHRVQLRVLEELVARDRPVLLGLEMYPYTQQAHLDRWIEGLLTERGFLELSEWYEHWGYRWEYYRDIFLLARDHGVPTFGLNVPRDVVRAVREQGLDGLDEEEAQHMPPVVDTDSAEHMRLFRAYFAEDDSFHATLSDEQWEGMFAAQCTWDATMAHNALRARAGHPDDAVLVVLVGSGHLAYGLGIQRQALPHFDGVIATLLPIPVRDEDDEPIRDVQASYADYVWGLPPSGHPIYPALGLSTTAVDDAPYRKVIHVAEGSVAERAGFAPGDVLLRMDGTELDGQAVLRRLLAGLEWGDAATFTVRRDDAEHTLEAVFRRTLEDEDA